MFWHINGLADVPNLLILLRCYKNGPVGPYDYVQEDAVSFSFGAQFGAHAVIVVNLLGTTNVR